MRSTREAILDAITPRTRGIIINSPCNPTGALIAEARAARRSPSARRSSDIWLVVDLCYEKLIYDAGAAQPAAACWPRRCPRSGGDLRLGVEGLRDDRLALRLGDRAGGGDRRVERDPEPLDVERRRRSRRRPSVAALTGSQAPVTAMLDEYRKRRDQPARLADGRSAAALPQAGRRVLHVRRHQRRCCRPTASRTSPDFAQALLEESRVAVTPGEAFDAPGFVRISYATSMDNLREGSRAPARVRRASTRRSRGGRPDERGDRQHAERRVSSAV